MKVCQGSGWKKADLVFLLDNVFERAMNKK